MATRGFIVQPTWRVRSGVPVVQLWGRLEEGPAFVVEDDRFRPYFFLPEAHAGHLAYADPLDVRVEPTSLRDLRDRPVLRVELPLPGAVPPLRERLRRAGAEPLEADVRFPYRYLVDRGVRATCEIDGDPEALGPELLRFRNPEIRPAEARVTLRTLSLDLETSPDASRLYSAALVAPGIEEVHLLCPRTVEGAVVYGDERALVEGILARIQALDPDVLLGWNVVDFDLRVLGRRCEALGVAYRLGRGELAPRFLPEPGLARRFRADVPGRMVLDGMELAREALRLPDYRLDTAARMSLGRGKRIDPDAPDAAAEIDRMFREDPEALVAYNLEDARLVPEILEREGLLALTVERSQLTGMQLDRVSASIACFDLVYLPELRRRGVVAPSVDPERKAELVTGGAVLDSQPGLWRDVAVFDFKSLYPSLIRTFHLDPLAAARAGDDALVAPNGARFSRTEAILPGVIERYAARREEARRRGDRHADTAIKIMTNALFGVLGAASCRFFDPKVANAITTFGQQTLRWTTEAFEAEGVVVLYGDTDSVFVQLPETRDAAARAACAAVLRERVQDRVAERIRATYRVEPRLTLELQRVFERFFLPRVRSGRVGSKKRYAGLAEGRLHLVGLESVRRDWPAVAHRLQEGMLERLFGDLPVAPFVKELVERVRGGELDDELVYAKRVRKGSLARYTATTPPHVQAARRAGGLAGPVVHYVIAADGPQPVLPGRPLPPRIDRGHYVERVLRPVAEGILAEIGSSFDEAVGNPRQLTLL